MGEYESFDKYMNNNYISLLNQFNNLYINKNIQLKIILLNLIKKKHDRSESDIKDIIKYYYNI